MHSELNNLTIFMQHPTNLKNVIMKHALDKVEEISKGCKLVVNTTVGALAQNFESAKTELFENFDGVKNVILAEI